MSATRTANICRVTNTDNTESVGIKGDVEHVERVPGRPGGKRFTDQGLIEVRLVGHPHRYRVRVDMSGPAPRLVELHVASDDDAAEITPAVMPIPVRRLTHTAARFIASGDGSWMTPDEAENPVLVSRPEVAERRTRSVLDDDHYRRVADLLTEARRQGAKSPRRVVAREIRGSDRPNDLVTVDRYIAEAKQRGFLPHDWATATTTEGTAR